MSRLQHIVHAALGAFGPAQETGARPSYARPSLSECLNYCAVQTATDYRSCADTCRGAKRAPARANQYSLYGDSALGAFGPAQETRTINQRITASRCVAQGGRLVTAGCVGNSCTYNCVTTTRGRGGWITATEQVDGTWRQA